jgi:vacuolar-type H+-ATPase subunit I/STV1
MAESLTMNLRLELEKTNLQFNRWASGQREALESNDSNYNHKLEEINVTIQALKDTDYELETSKTVNEAIKKQQQYELDQCAAQNSLLLQQKEVLEQQLRRCEDEEERENRRLGEVRAEHEVLRKKMEQTLNDLIYGMRHYTNLGLEFQKADGDCMKFIFTQILEEDPNKKFYFSIFVDSRNQYQLVETNPTLDSVVCTACVNELNIKNDIGKFVLSMRKLFKSLPH